MLTHMRPLKLSAVAILMKIYRVVCISIGFIVVLFLFFSPYRFTEIQHNHVSTAGVVSTISILFKFILFDYGH